MDVEEPLPVLPVRELRPQHIYEGYTYNVERIRDDRTTTYLVCKLTKRSHCKGRGILTNGRFRRTQDHNHATDPEADTIDNFKRQLRQSCDRQFRNQKEIYDGLRLVYPEAAVTVTYVSIESSMRRWRKAVHPRIPATLAEYGAILRLPQWTHVLDYSIKRLNLNENENASFRLECVTLTATDNSVSVVFGSPGFIALLPEVTEIFVDATFKVVPAINGAYQLLTVMATVQDHALPFAWALMSRKTRAAYDCVFDHIKTTLAPAINPTSFMTDFEGALQNSLSATYQGAVPHGCFFHYCQALYRKARSLRVTEAIADDEGGRKILQRIMALALLPGHEVELAFGILVMNTSPEHSRIFREFFDYYDTQWLRKVTPRLFSVYGLIRRTNNSVESYHRVLVEKMAPHPNIWDFTNYIDLRDFPAVNFRPGDDDDSENEAIRPIGIPLPNLDVVTHKMQTDCLVCEEAQSCYLSLPCYHMVLCGTCANKMLQLAYDYDGGENDLFGQANCPLCGTAVAEFKRVFMPVAQ